MQFHLFNIIIPRNLHFIIIMNYISNFTKGNFSTNIVLFIIEMIILFSVFQMKSNQYNGKKCIKISVECRIGKAQFGEKYND